MVTCGICHEERLNEIGELDSCDHGYLRIRRRSVHDSNRVLSSLPCNLWFPAAFVLHAFSNGLKSSPNAHSVRPGLQPSAERLWTWKGFLTVTLNRVIL